MIRIGVDIGGTFTDFAIWRGDAAGYTALGTYKAPSTPPRFAKAVMDGIDHILDRFALDPKDQILVVHGTTVGTNTVIERSGAKLALLTTKGFRDILGIARLRMTRATDLFNQRTQPLIPREHVFEIDERVLADGTVDRKLDERDVRRAVAQAKALGIEAVGICFLHAYREPAHENEARRIVEEAWPEAEVVVSHEVWSQQSEYERAVVTLLNAFVKKRMGDYIGEIEDYMASRLPRGRLFITRSNGGIMSAAEARRFPVHTLLSGPAAGVTASVTLGELTGVKDVLTMDMGGTSTDMALIRDGQAQVSTQAGVGDFPILMPVTAIEAIGAGGGSIAWMDGPVLKVGPRSVGASPGPACYGKGGTEPALSDAYLLCRYLGDEGLLGGRLPLDRAKAEAALKPIAKALNCDTTTAAESCIAVATSNMLAKVLPFLARLGVEPSDLTLMIFGGAGGIHGPLLAEEVGIKRIVVPRWPSVFCAFGCLVSDLTHDTIRSVRGTMPDAARLAAVYADLKREAEAWLGQQTENGTVLSTETACIADMRYAAQAFTIPVDVTALVDGGQGIEAYARTFHAEHLRLFGHNDPHGAIAIDEARVRLMGALPKPGATPAAKGAKAAPGPMRRRDLRYRGNWIEGVPIYAREELPPGWTGSGLAVIEQDNATILVPPGFAATVGEFGDLMLRKDS